MCYDAGTPLHPSTSAVLATAGRNAVPRLATLFVFVLSSALAPSSSAQAQESWWSGFAPVGFNRTVEAMIEFDGQLLVGGTFSYNGSTEAGSPVTWNGAQWVSMPNPGFIRHRAFAVYGSELYAGEYNRLIKWDGSIWTAVPGFFETHLFEAVTRLAVHDGKLVVGGNFFGVDGLSTGSLAAYDGSGWESLGGYTLFSSGDMGLAVYQGDLYVGSTFDSITGITAHSLARWDGAVWTPVLASDGMTTAEGIWADAGATTHGTVHALLVWNDKLVIAGDFERAGTLLVQDLVAYDGATQQWETVGGGTDGEVFSLGTHGADLVVGGEFANVGGVTPASNLARWNGVSWSAYGAGPNGKVLVVHDTGPELLVGGDFGMAGGVRCSKFAVWDGSTWAARQNPSGFGLDDTPAAMTVHDGLLIVAGRFEHAGMIEAARIAAWNGQSWQPLGSGADDHVLALYSDGTDLYAGGPFAQIGGISAPGIARWDGSAWHALGPGLTFYVEAIARHDGTLYAAGEDQLQSWNGSTWSPVPAGTSLSRYSALHSYAGQLVVGGSYVLQVNGDYTSVGLWDGTQWSAMVGPNGGSANGGVVAMEEWQGELILTGSLSQVDGGFSNNHCMRWDGATLALLLPNTFPTVGGGLQRGSALTVHEGDLVLGGEKSTNGYTAWRLSPGATEWVDVEGGTNGSVNALESQDGSLYLGGTFSTAGNGTISYRIARLAPAPTAAPPSAMAPKLRQNVPNPFNPSTRIEFSLAAASDVRLDVYDASGRRVRTLVHGRRPAGVHQAVWDGRDAHGCSVASGVYHVRLEAGDSVDLRKMVLLR